MRVPWTEKRSNQSILKEINSRISLEGMMLKLKLQYFGHLMQRVDSLEKTLMLGGIGGRRKRGQLRMRWLDGITDSMDMSLEDRVGGLSMNLVITTSQLPFFKLLLHVTCGIFFIVHNDIVKHKLLSPDYGGGNRRSKRF